ncbi:phage baseplate upper protein [Pediococcus acidilactici]|uniref:Phage baseplate upper protein n=1 Tax=Pediococcus acidilactici TaxID=1254 RepID=A0AAW8YNN4_PEDAC|nr:phage baseplate upper protein [Pediococcus acidilactici]MDV2911471.1 phage baseplate upper protein [Pediococcus acidilactici]WQS17242.1 phage baseplate upper protein [Pediococcus acidilactici]
MEVMTFNIDNDRRNLVDDKQNFSIDFHDSKYNWLQARQYEESMRQVEVHVVHGNGSPVDLTGMNPVFEGWLPEGLYRIIDAKHSVMIDAQNGIFRFDFPAPAFQIAGSYKQAFFRLMKDGMSVTTLEFSLDVMADKVISGLVPSDYITPFEDEYDKLTAIVENADSKFAEQLIKWKNEFDKTVGDLNGDYISIKSLADALDARLKNLEDKIKADGLLTQADFDAQIKIVNDTIKNALDQLKKPIPVGNSIIIGGPISVDEKNLLDKLRSTVDTSKFNLIFFNDSHYGMQSDIKNYGPRYGINHLNTALYLDDLVNVIVAGGDNIDGHLLSYDGLINDEQNFATELLFGSPNHADKFALKGNHDDGSLRLRWYREGSKYAPDSFPDTISNIQFKSDYMNGQLLFGEHRNNGDSNYFYKNYPDFKVRLIGLDSNDIPEDVKAADGGNKYVGLSNMGYRQEQLDWFANVALQNVPEDYVTIICAHSPATPTANDDTNLTDYTVTHYTNQAQLNQIIKDFINGQSSVITNDVEDWEIKVQTNFVAQGKRDVAGYIHGHYHYEELTTSQGFNNISCISAIPYTGFNKGAQNGGWTLFTLDRDNRKLKSTGYGLATNRTFDY